MVAPHDPIHFVMLCHSVDRVIAGRELDPLPGTPSVFQVWRLEQFPSSLFAVVQQLTCAEMPQLPLM